MSKYFTCAETAKFIRKDLKTHFPDTKFSVRSHVYAGGASINVRWIDAQPEKDIEAIARRYESSGFDGMIDYKYSKSHWLLPDGSIVLAFCEDTLECRGVVKGVDTPKPHKDAQAVRFGADFIFCSRELSIHSKKAVIALIEQKWGLKRPIELNDKGHIVEDWMHEGANCWVSQLMHRESVHRAFPLKEEEGA